MMAHTLPERQSAMATRLWRVRNDRTQSCSSFLPQRFPLGEGQVAVGPGLVDGDGFALQQTTLVGEGVCFFSKRDLH